MILTKIRKAASMGLATLFAWMIAGVAFAQTTTPAGATPGVPTTGAGGMSTSSLLIMALAAVVIIAGIVYLAYRPSSQQ